MGGQPQPLELTPGGKVNLHRILEHRSVRHGQRGDEKTERDF